jgi:hypothetical protein
LALVHRFGHIAILSTFNATEKFRRESLYDAGQRQKVADGCGAQTVCYGSELRTWMSKYFWGFLKFILNLLGYLTFAET